MDPRKFFATLFRMRKEPEGGASRILVVDSDVALANNLKNVLEAEGYQVCCVQSAGEATRTMRDHYCWLALVELNLPDGSGTLFLSDLSKNKSDCHCILMTARPDVDTAVFALEKGAFYYLQKPFREAELLELVELAHETTRLKEEKRRKEAQSQARNRELEEIVARLRAILDEVTISDGLSLSNPSESSRRNAEQRAG